MAAKRLEYIDMAKGIGIILVVMGHLERLNESLRSFIQTFHMPLFFIIAGMLMCCRHEEETPFWQIVSKKSKTVMVPYVSFGVLYFLIDLIAVGLGTVTMRQALRNVVDTATLYGVSVMWFLPALFLGELFFLYLLKNMNKRRALAASLALALAAWAANLALDRGPVLGLYQTSLMVNVFVNFLKVFLRAAVASSFIAVGYFVMDWNEELKRDDQKSLSGLLRGAGFIAAVLVSYRLNGNVDMHFMVFHNVLLYYILALGGSLGVILICRNIRSVRILMFYGRNSLIVMATHINGYFVYIAVVISLYINQFVTRAKDYVFCLSVLIILFSMEYPVILLFNRYLGFMLGRGKYKKIAEKENGRG